MVRRGLRRETLRHDGIFTLPLPEGQGTGLGKPLKLLTKPERDTIPICIAALGQKNVEMTAETPTAGCRSCSSPRRPARSGATRSTPGTAKRRTGPRPARDQRRRHGRHRRGPGDQGAARLRAADVRAVRRRHGRPRQELLQRPRRASTATRRRPRRSRTSTSAARSATPRRSVPAGVARGGQPGRPRVVRQGADRRLRRGRRHQPPVVPGHRRPGRHRSASSRNGCREPRRRLHRRGRVRHTCDGSGPSTRSDDADEIARRAHRRHEFPWDYTRAPAIAFLRDYGVPSIARAAGPDRRVRAPRRQAVRRHAAHRGGGHRRGHRLPARPRRRCAGSTASTATTTSPTTSSSTSWPPPSSARSSGSRATAGATSTRSSSQALARVTTRFGELMGITGLPDDVRRLPRAAASTTSASGSRSPRPTRGSPRPRIRIGREIAPSPLQAAAPGGSRSR